MTDRMERGDMGARAEEVGEEREGETGPGHGGQAEEQREEEVVEEEEAVEEGRKEARFGWH